MICEYCDTEIADSEKVCPKCGTDLEVVTPEVISHAERINTIVDKRRKKKEEAERIEREKNQPKKKPGFFDGFRKVK